MRLPQGCPFLILVDSGYFFCVHNNLWSNMGSNFHIGRKEKCKQLKINHLQAVSASGGNRYAIVNQMIINFRLRFHLQNRYFNPTLNISAITYALFILLGISDDQICFTLSHPCHLVVSSLHLHHTTRPFIRATLGTYFLRFFQSCFQI